MQLRECFMITALEGGGEQIVCKYCPDYNKTLQKFNPTKSRTHLTDHCPGVDDGLRQILLSNTQAAKANMKTEEGGMPALPGSKPKRGPNRKSVVVANRLSPTYLSFFADQTTSLDVTAPIENGQLILRLSFPDSLKLSFVADQNLTGAAAAVDGFMNMMPDATWAASLHSMTTEGTRAGPHCNWPLVAAGDGMTRAEKIEQLLKTMVMK